MWVASLEPFVQPFMSVVQAKLKGLGFVCKHSHKHGSFSQKQWNLLPVSVNLFPKKSYGSFWGMKGCRWKAASLPLCSRMQFVGRRQKSNVSSTVDVWVNQWAEFGLGSVCFCVGFCRLEASALIHIKDVSIFHKWCRSPWSFNSLWGCDMKCKCREWERCRLLTVSLVINGCSKDSLGSENRFCICFGGDSWQWCSIQQYVCAWLLTDSNTNSLSSQPVVKSDDIYSKADFSGLNLDGDFCVCLPACA